MSLSCRFAWLAWIVLVGAGYIRTVFVHHEVSPPGLDPALMEARLTGSDHLSLLAREGWALAITLMVASASLGAGAGCGRWMLPRRGPGLPTTLALGSGVLGLIMFGLSFTGLARLPVVAVVCFIGATVGAHRLVRVPRRDRIWQRSSGRWMIGAGLLVTVALAPETGVDALYYHLPMAEALRRLGKFPVLPFAAFHLQPLWEHLTAMPLTLGGEASAKLLTPGAIILSAGLLWESLTVRPGAPGTTAALLLLATCPLLMMAVSATNDPAAMAFAVGSFGTALEARRRRSSGRATLAGCLGGCALATKLTTIPSILAAALILGWPAGRRHRNPVRWFVAGAVLPVTPWMARNALVLGNPFFPIEVPWLNGGTVLAREAAAALRGDATSYLRGSYTGLAGRLAALWTMATGEGGLLLPALALPAVLLGLGRGGERARWSLAAVLGAAVWAVAVPRDRYLLPALPFSCAVLALWTRERAGTSRRLATATLALAIGLESVRWAVTAGPDAAARWQVALTLVQPEAFRESRLTAFGHARRWMETNLPPDARVLVYGDPRSYPLPHTVFGSSIIESPVFLRAAAASGDARRLACRMRQTGATHLVYNRVSAVYYRERQARLALPSQALGLWAGWLRGHADLLYEPPYLDLREGGFYVLGLRGPPARATMVLPGCEGWLVVPEHLAAAGRWLEAERSMNALTRITGDFAMLRHARATLLAPALSPSACRRLLESVDAAGVRSVTLLEQLAALAEEAGHAGAAQAYRQRAAALSPDSYYRRPTSRIPSRP